MYDDDMAEVSGHPTYDPLAYADWIRDEAKYDLRCSTCGQVAVSFEGAFCNLCPDQTGYLATKAAREARESDAA
jgi:rRNA maturation endonuclease Nob1